MKKKTRMPLLWQQVLFMFSPIPGIENARSDAVDAHEVETGENVVVCGGGITGLECALTLAKEGKSVTVVDQLKREDFIAKCRFLIKRIYWISWRI